MILFGHDVNLIWALLTFMTLVLTVGGTLVMSFLKRFTPAWFVDTYMYGKAGTESASNPLVKLTQIPKSYFTHFYVYAVLLHTVLLYLVLNVYLIGVELPDWMLHGLDWVATKDRARSKVTPESVLLALVLMTAQVWCRMYECAYVNGPSKAKINLVHYLTGYLHYTCVGLGIVSHAPGLLRPHSLHFEGVHQSIKWIHIQLQWTNLSVAQIAGACIFVWAMKHQRIAHKILARTKRNSASGYGVPSGDWFDLVSCPHYAAECLLYISLVVVLGLDHTTGILICVWVVSNQVLVALMSHQWYKQNFPNYSKKAIVPYIL